MAGVRRSSAWPLVAVALLAAAAGLSAQANGTGVLAGRLTDVRSLPLDRATVVVRNEATGAEARGTTGHNGSYRFNGLEPGEYTLEADSEQLGHGRLEGIVVSAGHEARVLAAMEFVLPSPKPIPDAAHAVDAARPMAPTAGAKSFAAALLIPTEIKDLSAGIPVEPMAAALAPLPEFTMSARGIAEPAREMPAIRSVALHPAGAGLSTEVLVVTAMVDTEPLLGLPLAGLAMSVASSQHRGESALDAAQGGDPVTPTVTTTVTGEQLHALPVSGRRWQDFVLDRPNASTAAAGAGPEPKATVDGASVGLAFGGRGGSESSSSGPGTNGQGGPAQNGMGQAWSGGRGSILAEAAIRQVETEAGNVEAEGARAAGGRMGIETQSGETRHGVSGLHGQGFLFDRQNTWGAQNPFTRWVKQTAPATEITTPVFTAEPYTPPDHETTWGIGAGGPVRRDNLFWFAALDGYRRNDPGLATVKNPAEFFAQPSNDQAQVLSARLGLNRANPVAEGLAAYSSMLGTLDGLLGPAPRTATQWVGFSRIDWEAAERHRFTLEGIGAAWNSPGGGLTRASEAFGASSFGSSQASQEWLLGRWEAFLTPNLLAVTQGSVGRAIQTAHAETPSAFEQAFLSPSVWSQLPQIVVDSRYGFTIGNPSRFGQGSYPDERLYEAQEALDWVHGTLLVKAGINLNHNADVTNLLRNQTGTYSYASVENFASDALVFGKFGSTSALDPDNQRNCDQTGRVWRDSTGQLHGLGSLPCYAYYSQVVGPTYWHLSTNDWADFATAQWQPKKLLVFSAGLRWQMEQMPPPIAALANPELPLTGKLPSLGSNWGPRISMALGNAEARWPVLRLGYGMYYGRTENATLETALTQTGSLNGDLNLFMRPTDGYNSATATGDAPPFPCVLPVASGCGWSGSPASIVKPGAVEFVPRFRNPEVHQGVVTAEESLPSHVEVTASAMVSLGRRLPISIDTNFDPTVNPGTITYGVVDGTGLGPIKAAQITVPFYASWPGTARLASGGAGGRLNPDYQQISAIMSRANSTYEALMLKVRRNSRRGLSLHAHYTYAHAMDWNPNEITLVAGSDVLDPANFSQEYGTSNLDMRHSAAAMVIYEAPWKLHNLAGRLANAWMVSGIGQFRSGLPYTMHTSGSLAEEFNSANGGAIVGLGPGMNGSGGDNRVYGLGNDGRAYNIGRNTYRYPTTWKADMRLGKSFDLGPMRQLEILVESFNLFNHQNVTELETTGYYLEPGNLDGGFPTLNFLTGLKANTTAFGQPLNVNATDFYRERQLQFGMRMRF